MNSQVRWLLRRGRDTLRFEGPLILLWRVFRVALSPLGDFRTLAYWRRDLTQPVTVREARTTVAIAPASGEELDQLGAVIEASYSPARRAEELVERSVETMLRQRFARGARCFVARRGGEIVHYNWIFEGRHECAEALIDLREGEALCDDGFTVAGHRGLGIHGAVTSRMLAYLRDHGYHTAYTRVRADNTASQKTLRRLGWQPYGMLLFLRLRGSRRMLSLTLRGPLDPVAPHGFFSRVAE